MVSKRAALVIFMLAAIGISLITFSGTDAQPEASPAAGSPAATPIRIGGADPSPVSVVQPSDLPACFECYFGLWELTVTGQVEVAPVAARLQAYVTSGSITVTPDGGTHMENTDLFRWPVNETATVSAQEGTATAYLLGLVPGRDASNIQGLRLLGGAAFHAQSEQDYDFIIGKVTLDENSDPLLFDPDIWPAILDVTEGEVETTTALVSLGANYPVIDVSSFDEFSAGVEILLPATLVQITRTAGSDSNVVIWYAGISSPAPVGSPGCSWACRK